MSLIILRRLKSRALFFVLLLGVGHFSWGGEYRAVGRVGDDGLSGRSADVATDVKASSVANVPVGSVDSFDDFSYLPVFNPQPNPFFKGAGAFSYGEHIEYNIYFFGIQVGDMSLSVSPQLSVRGRDTYKFVAESELTLWWFGGTYRVSGLVDAKTFKALDMKMEKLSKPGRMHTFWVHELYDWFNLRVHYDQQINKKHKQDLFLMRNYSQNSLSTFYYFRTLPLRVGQSYNFPVTTKGQNKVAKVEVLNREVLCLRDLGCLKSLKLKMHTILWHLSTPKPLSISIWVTDDKHKYMLKSKSSGVSVVARTLPGE